jgi:hypothetical protein
VVVFFLFFIGRKRFLVEAARYFARREKDEDANQIGLLQ